MDEKKMTDLEKIKEKFIEKYRSLSKEQKLEVMMMFNGQPFTWNPVWLEVSQNTPMGEEMLEQWDFYSTLLQQTRQDAVRGFERYMNSVETMEQIDEKWFMPRMTIKEFRQKVDDFLSSTKEGLKK